MKVSFNEQDGVIIRHFSGEVCFADMLESWEILLASYPRLKDYKGILTSFLDADIRHEDDNLNDMVEFLKGYVDQLRDLKIAMVMNTPMVTNTIIVSEKVKFMQIKPFSSVEAAMSWIQG